MCAAERWTMRKTTRRESKRPSIAMLKRIHLPLREATCMKTLTAVASIYVFISSPSFAVADDSSNNLESSMKEARELIYSDKREPQKRKFPFSLSDLMKREGGSDPIESFTVYGTTSKKYYIEVI